MTNRRKYPRTPHLPWSPGFNHDDVRTLNVKAFEGKRIVVTEKMDGENTILYRDGLHARSLDSRHHPSRDWVKQWHSTIAHEIPKGWRVCGENLYAQHSITYTDLLSYFYGFSLWNDKNYCLGWEETLEWFDLLNIAVPTVFYHGIWDEELIKAISVNEQKVEGYVVRIVESFAYDAFSRSVAKWVRSNHVQTDEHWMFMELVPNGLEPNGG
ncbi:RNA ligase family protein [Marinibactrum halimedae]|uniref:2'-5' RNA ligase n=1 Tax=Marinibactrum halimedae TaxID=1444977 RepID=A0AA37T967_9GAMM|nr:RNA ligase family protein [Marinibactrum halimedae]MCD9457929.1 RNA ligase family protein [Marinibactrum halimedae]GLS26246.1 2'-5' RNA ligase [Marinibactrum halimedae]